MKKLMTILVIFAMCGAAVAAVNGNSSAAEQIPLTNGKHQYINFVDEYHQGQSALSYTVTNSQQLITGYGKHWVNYKYVTNYNDPKYGNDGHNIGHVYFTTADQNYINTFNAEHETNMTNVVVQFAGTYMDSGSNDMVKDYGIYLYDPKTKTAGEYWSVSTGTNGTRNWFELDPNQTFGVYYDELQANGEIKRITTTANWVGNYDTGNSDKVTGANDITVYDAEHPAGYDTITYKKFMCLLETNSNVNGAEQTHWEFMLQTKLDNPYYNVNVDDFNGNGDTFTSGQPLPGTLATLLIGSLCASALRKKNQK